MPRNLPAMGLWNKIFGSPKRRATPQPATVPGQGCSLARLGCAAAPGGRTHENPCHHVREVDVRAVVYRFRSGRQTLDRSEEHTSELQSLRHLVCRLLL